LSLNLGLIDYGMGNLHSVEKCLERLDQGCSLIHNADDLEGVDALILPGVGAFDPAMANLRATGLVPHLLRWGQEDRPLLGICLGLQLLFEQSDEGRDPGLGLLGGRVSRLPSNSGERIPHMGWAPLKHHGSCPLLSSDAPSEWVYFVHSYAAVPSDRNDLKASAPFGDQEVTAVVWRGRVGACQFHPEKSSDAGEEMLKRWLTWLRNGAEPCP